MQACCVTGTTSQRHGCHPQHGYQQGQKRHWPIDRHHDGLCHGAKCKIGDGDGWAIQAVVASICTDCRPDIHRVGLIAICDAIVDAGNDDGLRNAPVAGREDKTARRYRALGDVLADDRKRHCG